ncbi:uncharacterized protein LOC128386279 [Panonychus citri]|uniref:uncharacterized protein LOC128386279 n=1 Tax=Panonychus citri TaxID=50023 RepID=UPI0023071B73|nr:uncharacterized protein LOC128386279 [Panonychus citri]
MLLNDLPDDCLWLIFDNFFKLEELIQLSEVCSKWSNLIDLRFKKVKYLFNKSRLVPHLDYSKVWMEQLKTIRRYNLRELLPNLRIFDISYHYYGQTYKMHYFEKVINNPKIKGIVGLNTFYDYNLKNIEMVSIDFLRAPYKKRFRRDQLKQIRYKDYFYLHNLFELVEYFPNLKRLNIWFSGEQVRYNGPNLPNLKIFESAISGKSDNCNAFHVMDFCPSLESAYIYNQSDDKFTNMAQKNYNLRDFVIGIPLGIHLTWSFLRGLLSKYPNLQNLAVRGGDAIKDSRVEELVKLLPEIKLLDFRRSKGVTSKSADFLSKFCRKSYRSIKIYYDCEKEPIDWPKLDTPEELIVYGFDFMKHCFYKNFHRLPDLIDE